MTKEELIDEYSKSLCRAVNRGDDVVDSAKELIKEIYQSETWDDGVDTAIRRLEVYIKNWEKKFDD